MFFPDDNAGGVTRSTASYVEQSILTVALVGRFFSHLHSSSHMVVSACNKNIRCLDFKVEILNHYTCSTTWLLQGYFLLICPESHEQSCPDIFKF